MLTAITGTILSIDNLLHFISMHLKHIYEQLFQSFEQNDSFYSHYTRLGKIVLYKNLK